MARAYLAKEIPLSDQMSPCKEAYKDMLKRGYLREGETTSALAKLDHEALELADFFPLQVTRPLDFEKRLAEGKGVCRFWKAGFSEQPVFGGRLENGSELRRLTKEGTGFRKALAPSYEALRKEGSRPKGEMTETGVRLAMALVVAAVATISQVNAAGWTYQPTASTCTGTNADPCGPVRAYSTPASAWLCVQ